MNHGYDDDEDDLDMGPPPPRRQPQGGPSGLMAQLMGGMAGGMSGMGGMGFGGFQRAAPPEAYDDYFKAYSVAVMDRKDRPELLYGGKIVMPPSALARLSALDIEGPWTFQIRNPRNPSQFKTHAGVLEFIAEEGIVHLPAWMMRTLNLNEGDPVRLNGAALPKGKMVKIQAQSTEFLQVSDPKAVLESALRFYSVLSKGDIIEITYNDLTFEFLIMTTTPEGPGISVIDTDLEVDFETPVGYVEPERKPAAPIPTMADKLKIDLGGTTPASSSTSRPSSAASSALGAEGQPSVFTGYGQSLSGKRVKGKGLAKKIEEVDVNSRINRADGPRIITPDSFNDDRKVPSALHLPKGKFFFGYTYVPFDPAKVVKRPVDILPTGPFGGQGTSLRSQVKSGSQAQAPNQGESSASGAAATAVAKPEAEDPWAKFGSGSGNTLSGGSGSTSKAKEAKVESVKSAEQQRQEVIDATMLDDDDFWGDDVMDDDDDEDNDIIEIDSD